jgi:hypothetical protein
VFSDAALRSTDDCHLPGNDNGALEQLLVFDKDVDNLVVSGDVAIRELKLLEFAVSTNQVGSWIFEFCDDVADLISVRWVLDVVDRLEVDAEFFCNAHGINRRISMLVVIYPNIGHVS